ncbi:uncharacterized protein VP01_903g6 [Puccinia sorghi]|uniref:26S proteasome regulatory subunit 6B homolog n=1 Tax=Puccinia sorghi TaxID=27349 RepID=A0A0L6U7Q6_9BASI|nr:uncharacterized protein VP01_903g6 [Puccinia sorghi]
MDSYSMDDMGKEWTGVGPAPTPTPTTREIRRIWCEMIDDHHQLTVNKNTQQKTSVNNDQAKQKSSRTHRMSDQPPSEQPSNQQGSSKAASDPSNPQPSSSSAGKEPASEDVKMEAEPELDPEILKASPEEIMTRTRLLDNEIKIMRSENLTLSHEATMMLDKIKDNTDKIKNNKQLPFLVANVVEILDIDPDVHESEEGAQVDLDSTIFLPLIGLVDADKLKPGDLIGVNKDSYLVLDTLPAEYDSRVKAMEVDERPTETYTDIGGLDKQIEELVEAVVLPMQQADKFKTLGIKPPKGVLMYGPPGTGKTLLARACAAQTKACYMKLAGPSLVQMFIGDGAKLVRDAFELAKEKAPAIIFIDELDAIGTKRFDSEKSGDREVQRTMLELLNQLDGFGSDDRIKVISHSHPLTIHLMADISGVGLLLTDARARIIEIHSRKMNVGKGVNFEELARSTDEFNAAQLRAVAVEAGMIALREGANEIHHEHFLSGILEVQSKKKNDQFYFA